MPEGTSWRAKLSSVDHDAVTGVVATLVAHDKIHVTSQKVGEFSLAFVTPLGSDYHGCGHWTPSRRPRCKQSLPEENVPFGLVKGEDAVHRVDRDGVALLVDALQDGEGEGVFEPALDHALQGTRAVGRIEPFGRERVRRGRA